MSNLKILSLIDKAYFYSQENWKRFFGSYIFSLLPLIIVVLMVTSDRENFLLSKYNIFFYTLLVTISLIWKNYFELNTILKVSEDLFQRKLSLKFSEKFLLSQRTFVVDVILFMPLSFSFVISDSSFSLLYWWIPIFSLSYICKYFALPPHNLPMGKIFFKLFSTISENFLTFLSLNFYLLLVYLVVFFNVVIVTVLVMFFYKVFSGDLTLFSSMDLYVLINFMFSDLKFAFYTMITYMCGNFFSMSSNLFFCFNSESNDNGSDITAEIKTLRKKNNSNIKKIMAIIGVFFILNLTYSQEVDNHNQLDESQGFSTINGDKFNESINNVKNDEKYQWNTDSAIKIENNELFTKISEEVNLFLDDMNILVKNFFKSILDWFESKNNSPSPADSMNFWAKNEALFKSLATIFVLILIVAVVVLIIIKLVNMKKNSRALTQTEHLSMKVDLEKEDVTADVLKLNEWLALAVDLEKKGEFRLALRAYYLYVIALLSEADFVIIKKGKTDLEYLRELKNKHHVTCKFIKPFSDGLNIFQQEWYGHFTDSKEIVQLFKDSTRIIFKLDSKVLTEGDING
ncbi:hypothetical protein AAEX28_01250 [Lentisphaerota bacterium WC36G]|nr:hypothetical protein LJT99_04135 [Lentisphaerae bacterium WC36]